MEERLRKFAKIAEIKSFTKAAQALHTSQPALSVALAKLERELGATLINRDTLQLTNAGQLAYQHAQQLEVQRGNLRQQMSALKNQKPQLALGIIDSLADTLLLSNGQLEKLEKKASVNLSVNNSRYLLEALENNQLDMVCIVQPANLPKKLMSYNLGSEPLLGVTTAVHKSKLKDHIPNFLAYDQNSHTNRLIKQYFDSQQITLDSVFHSTSPEIILHMTLNGRGSAVLPYALVESQIANGQLLPFTGVIERRIVAAWHRDKILPDAALELQQIASDLLVKQNRGAKRLTVL
jgi:DNA-binding transcriptional LysR family regulator